MRPNAGLAANLDNDVIPDINLGTARPMALVEDSITITAQGRR